MSTRPLALVPLAATLFFGPPSIKVTQVRSPVPNGPVFAIEAHHHVSTDRIAVTGRVEGIENGRRTTRALALTSTGAGEYAVTKQWAAGQPWVLVFTIRSTDHDSLGVAEAMVPLAADGKVGAIEYPTQRLERGYPWPRRVAAGEIDAALRRLGAR